MIKVILGYTEHWVVSCNFNSNAHPSTIFIIYLFVPDRVCVYSFAVFPGTQ